ncbi:hypothetical protein AXF42_Ash007044 [Apostasia shenzhenica]|uniref:Uncharacterized protein n=1 Tax=Apostasia shenzhenica TaxID=1088818 RepID=A0A2I0BEW5_9ASPA|nr:hypothetical protein AXF42_Ash007044 [Apostasia shenzhenica]
MALQYLSQCIGKCSINDTLSCQPPEVDITEVYAPNCGVELPTIGTISGNLQGCHWGYLNPEKALSIILHKNKKSVSLLQSKDQTGIGVGFKSLKGETSYWCVLLSNVTSKSGFVLEAGGKGIQQKNGCFSGADEPCSSGNQIAFSGLGYFKLVVCILFSLLIFYLDCEFVVIEIARVVGI